MRQLNHRVAASRNTPTANANRKATAATNNVTVIRHVATAVKRNAMVTSVINHAAMMPKTMATVAVTNHAAATAATIAAAIIVEMIIVVAIVVVTTIAAMKAVVTHAITPAQRIKVVAKVAHKAVRSKTAIKPN